MNKPQTISAIRKQLRLHAAQSTTFATLDKSSIHIRSVAGVLVMEFEKGERKNLIELLDQMDDKKIIKTIL
jgi:hypothetical protein